MLPVLITIDTEYSSGMYRRGEGRERAANFARTIACRGKRGESGIHYQMDVFGQHGITAVFFAHPMPALVWGQEAVDAVVKPILARGHEVQLHLHTEWLELAGDANPLGHRTGQNMKDFSLFEQRQLLAYGRDRLMQAGAPAPTAFRAGNYGANDDTLRALAELGIAMDSSFAPGFAESCCAIDLPLGQCAPVEREGVMEWPIAAIRAGRGKWRHGQVTALSFAEMRAAVRHAAASRWPALVLVSHGFELFNRDRGEPNPVLMRRFEDFCEWLGSCDIARGAGFAALPQQLPDNGAPLRLLPHNPLRTAARVVEQLRANRA